MVYKKIANEKGNYKDENEVRFDVLEAHEAYTPEGINIGWNEFVSIEEALAEYGLVYEPLPQEVSEQPFGYEEDIDNQLA